MAKPIVCMNVDALDAAFTQMRDTLSEYAVVTVAEGDYSLSGVDIFIGKKLDEKKLAAADKLKAVFAYKTGVDDFPIAALKNKGVTLCNSHINSEYIAEYAFSLALAVTGRVAEFDRRMRAGDWAVDNPYWKSLFSMHVGLVGYGAIGRAVHQILLANNIATYTLDRGKAYENITAVKDLDELCSVCDLLILSLPKTPDTDKMFDARVFSMLKGKYIVNVGRNNCIDEAALYNALKSGTLAGAAIDTWREKQRDKNKPLKPFDVPFDTLDNIVLSSHKAMQAYDGHLKYVLDTTDNVVSYINGNTPRNIVDYNKGY